MISFLRSVFLVLMILLGALFVAAVSGVLAARLLDTLGFPSDDQYLASAVLCFLFVYFFLVIRSLSKSRSRRELAPIEAELAGLRAKVNEGAKHRTGQLVEAELRHHFTITRNQSRYSFAASLTAGGVGLISLIAAMFFSSSDKNDLAYVSGAAGVLSEFIGATLLTLYYSTGRKMSRILSRLEFHQSILLALEEAERLADATRRDKLREELIAFTLGQSIDVPGVSNQRKGMPIPPGGLAQVPDGVP